MSRRRRSDYRLSLGWILGVTFIGTLTRLKLPQWSSLSFGAAVCLRLPPHTTSQRKLSRLATDHATCSCLRLTVATNSPRKGLSPPIQCPCRAHQRARTVGAYFIDAGYKGRIKTLGRGEAAQFQPDDPGRYSREQLHQMSRRVELVR